MWRCWLYAFYDLNNETQNVIMWKFRILDSKSKLPSKSKWVKLLFGRSTPQTYSGHSLLSVRRRGDDVNLVVFALLTVALQLVFATHLFAVFCDLFHFWGAFGNWLRNRIEDNQLSSASESNARIYVVLERPAQEIKEQKQFSFLRSSSGNPSPSTSPRRRHTVRAS